MADTILTLTQIEDFFQSLTTRMLGLDPAAPENQKRVVIGWAKVGQPAWKISDDVAFLFVSPDDDPISQQVETGYQAADADNADLLLSYTRVLRVTWNLYGPNSFDDAEKVRSSLYLPEYKSLMAAMNLSYIVNGNAPMRTPEPFNGQWWERSTYSARFNELVVRRSTVPYIQSADVQIVKG